jgi:formate dehydrogenase assembly factor FdhD
LFTGDLELSFGFLFSSGAIGKLDGLFLTENFQIAKQKDNSKLQVQKLMNKKNGKIKDWFNIKIYKF